LSTMLQCCQFVDLDSFKTAGEGHTESRDRLRIRPLVKTPVSRHDDRDLFSFHGRGEIAYDITDTPHLAAGNAIVLGGEHADVHVQRRRCNN